MSKVLAQSNIRIIPRDEGFLNRKVGTKGEVFYDQNTNTLRLYDGDTVGGFSLAKTDLSNVIDEAFKAKVLSSIDQTDIVTIGPSLPETPTRGQFWLNSKSNSLYLYSGTAWIQTFPFKNDSAIAEIEFPSNPAVGDTFTSNSAHWKWDGQVWGLEPIVPNLTVSNNLNITGTVSGLNLSDISDVDVSSATNGQSLVYNGTSQKWVPSSSSSFNGGTITNPLIINNNTATTGTSSGALRITGGVAIGDDLYVAGTITVEDENLDLKSKANLRFFTANNQHYVGFTASDSTTQSKIYVLPSSDGSSGQFLRTNGSGVLSWASASGAGGGTPPGGLNKQIQFNDNGAFAGNPTFTFDQGLSLITVPSLTATGTVIVSADVESTSASTGSLNVVGGVGVEGQINVSGLTSTFTGNTPSTSTITGTIVVTGGVGISGQVNVGDTVSAPTQPTSSSHLTNKRYVDANILAFSVAFGA